MPVSTDILPYHGTMIRRTVRNHGLDMTSICPANLTVVKNKSYKNLCTVLRQHFRLFLSSEARGESMQEKRLDGEASNDIHATTVDSVYSNYTDAVTQGCFIHVLSDTP
ncbi:hypothetical protein DINM_004265 [Dirofilaria immitis]|nr:hypothetical protein [Dirofilaria immitis]